MPTKRYSTEQIVSKLRLRRDKPAIWVGQRTQRRHASMWGHRAGVALEAAFTNCSPLPPRPRVGRRAPA